MTYSPIALFVYNRPEHTRLSIDALKNNVLSADSDLIIFSDAAKSNAQITPVLQVRDYLKKVDGFKSISIVERESNLGLARSVIDGVTSVVNQFGRVIVLEDDLVTSPYFLQYMNDGLSLYEINDAVASIHGYVYPIDNLPETFFIRGADCWGWATWKDKWAIFEPDSAKLLSELKCGNLTKRFDYNGAYLFSKMLADQISGKNNSWAVRWHASAFLKNKYTLYPGKSLVLNIGHDGSGTHCGETDVFSSAMCNKVVRVLSIAVENNQQALLAFEYYLRKQKIGIFRRFQLLIIKAYGQI